MELAKLIALLHDIGRFEQLKRFNSFEADTMDHATYGVQVLFEEGMIRQFIEEDTWDDVIRTAIAKHSDYELTGITDERTLLHARLIRDADKLDNCRVKLEDAMETLLDLSADEVGKYAISPKVREDAFAGKCICSKDRRTPMDYWVSYVAYFYDLMQHCSGNTDFYRYRDGTAFCTDRICVFPVSVSWNTDHRRPQGKGGTETKISCPLSYI